MLMITMKIKKVYIQPQTEILDMDIFQLCYSMPTDGNTDDNWSRGNDSNFKDESEETDVTEGVVY